MTAILRSCVRGVGAALPARFVTNDELAHSVDTSDEWIRQRTGIKQRYVAGEGETTSTLATGAAEAALRDAGLAAADIDLVIVATATPDYTFPAVATQVQANLGIVEGAAFDLQAVCTGFVYAVATADKFLVSGSHKRALVIGAETFSRILDWSDRTTCVLFGDGAGAIVLEASESDGAADAPGVIASKLRADGRHRTKLYVDGGPSTTRTVGCLRMEGKEVFRHAVGMVTDVIQGCLADAGIDGRGDRLVRAASGEQAHHRRHCRQARHSEGQGGRHRRPARQHLRRLHPARACGRGEGRPDQERRPRDDPGDGRRLHLGRGADPLVGRKAGPRPACDALGPI